MFNFLKDLFLSKIVPNIRTKTKAELPKQSDTCCSLEIQMNNDGTINILCSWPEFSENNKDKMITVANNYALMINAINNGYLSGEIIHTIKNYKSHDPYDSLFAQNVYYKITELNLFKEKTTSNKLNNQPLIRPLIAFKNLYNN
jgi:hypothetical protein